MEAFYAVSLIIFTCFCTWLTLQVHNLKQEIKQNLETNFNDTFDNTIEHMTTLIQKIHLVHNGNVDIKRELKKMHCSLEVIEAVLFPDHENDEKTT